MHLEQPLDGTGGAYAIDLATLFMYTSLNAVCNNGFLSHGGVSALVAAWHCRSQLPLF